KPGQPRSVTPLLILQIRAVIGTGYRSVREKGEISEQVDGANLLKPFLHFQQSAEVEALDVGPIFQSVIHNCSGHYPRERLGADGVIGELLARIYLGFNIESDFLRIPPSPCSVGMGASRTDTIIVGVERHEIEDLLQGWHYIWILQAAGCSERGRHL